MIINIAHAGAIQDAPSVSYIGMNVLNFLLSVTGVIAIIMLVISAIMYFFSRGDMKAVQIAKKTAQYCVLGLIFVMSGMILIRMIGQFFQTN